MTFRKTWRAYQSRLLSHLDDYLQNRRLHLVSSAGIGQDSSGSRSDKAGESAPPRCWQPLENRQLLLNKEWNNWKEAILRDLERVHHDIRKCVSRIDIMRMGHAMARPKVGAIFSAERRNLAKAHGRILFANSDLSGFSIFEEAQYRGVNAADRVLSQLAGAHSPGALTVL